MTVYNGQLSLLYFEMASIRLEEKPIEKLLDFFHDYVFHFSIMEHGSFFFQPNSFKLEQVVYMLV
jgi:hypothetical protein